MPALGTSQLAFSSKYPKLISKTSKKLIHWQHHMIFTEYSSPTLHIWPFFSKYFGCQRWYHTPTFWKLMSKFRASVTQQAHFCIEFSFWELCFLPRQRLFLSRKEEILSPSPVSFITHPQFPSETAQDFENYSVLARALRI